MFITIKKSRGCWSVSQIDWSMNIVSFSTKALHSLIEGGDLEEMSRLGKQGVVLWKLGFGCMSVRACWGKLMYCWSLPNFLCVWPSLFRRLVREGRAQTRPGHALHPLVYGHRVVLYNSLLEDGDLGEMSRLVKLVILIRAPCQWPELKAVTSFLQLHRKSHVDGQTGGVEGACLEDDGAESEGGVVVAVLVEPLQLRDPHIWGIPEHLRALLHVWGDQAEGVDGQLDDYAL